jgi:probable phosphoglycerate mutase
VPELWFIRHATTAWTGRRWCGSTDLSLDDGGRAAAAALAQRLSPRVPSPATVLTSPLARTRQTAAPLCAALGVEAEVDERLREISFGAVEGSVWDDIETTYPDVAAQVSQGVMVLDWPGGEPRRETLARARSVWERLDEPGDGVTIVFSHGAIIRAILDARDIEVGILSPATGFRLHREDGAGWRLDDARL